MDNKFSVLAVVVCVAIAGCGGLCPTGAGKAVEPMLAHNVYFTLNDDSEASIQEFIESCNKYLKDHPGVVFFAAGPREKGLNRSVNVQDFDVGLHIVFKNKSFHDRYQNAEKHQQFIKVNEGKLKLVRVFDTLVR
jgi:hypothetical protein